MLMLIRIFTFRKYSLCYTERISKCKHFQRTFFFLLRFCLVSQLYMNIYSFIKCICLPAIKILGYCVYVYVCTCLCVTDVRSMYGNEEFVAGL